MASRQTCWSLVLSWWYWFVMVLAHGIVLFYYYYWAPWSMIWGRACLYKEKEIIWLRNAFGLNILRYEILGYCFKSSIYMKVKWKANLWRVISRALQLRKCGGAIGDATEAPQKAQCGDATEAPQKAQCGDATEGAVRRRHRRHHRGATEGAMRRRHRRRSCGGARRHRRWSA